MIIAISIFAACNDDLASIFSNSCDAAFAPEEMTKTVGISIRSPVWRPQLSDGCGRAFGLQQERCRFASHWGLCPTDASFLEVPGESEEARRRSAEIFDFAVGKFAAHLEILYRHPNRRDFRRESIDTSGH